MCPNCDGNIFLDIKPSLEIEFIPGHKFIVSNENLNRDKNFQLFVSEIFRNYINDRLNLSLLRQFIEKSIFRLPYTKGYCPKCFCEVQGIEIIFYGLIAYIYEELLEELFLDAFKEKYHADGRFLITRKDEIPNLSELLFHRDDKCSLRLYKLLDIYKYIPFERGGGGDEILEFAVKSVVVPLFVNFLYQIILQNKAEQFKKFIKQKHEDYKKNLDNKKILKQFEKYMKNENVEWNEDKAIELVKSGLDELTNKYIESLY